MGRNGAAKRKSRVVPDGVRAELDQSPAWWQGEFNKLHAAAFEARPFVEDEHFGHSWVEGRYYSGRVERYCCECPTVWMPKRKGGADD